MEDVVIEFYGKFFFFLASDGIFSQLQIKKQILSAQSTVKEYIVGSKKESQESHVGRLDSNKDNP